MLSNGFPLAILVFLFGVYVAIGETLTSKKSYSVLAYINLMLGPLKMLMYAFMMYINAKASLKRLQHFIDSEDKNETYQVLDETLPKGTIQITEDADFQWENISAAQHEQNGRDLIRKIQTKGKPTKEEPKNLVEEIKKKNLTILKDINFKAESGQLTAVIGQVASGKSTLIHALLGELIQTKGKVSYNGTIAYVS